MVFKGRGQKSDLPSPKTWFSLTQPSDPPHDLSLKSNGKDLTETFKQLNIYSSPGQSHCCSYGLWIFPTVMSFVSLNTLMWLQER